MAVAEPEVRVAAGALRGRLESGLAVFKGIPFAEPPARFAAPGPVQAWDGIGTPCRTARGPRSRACPAGTRCPSPPRAG
jgi:carboxylesterase type B